MVLEFAKDPQTGVWVPPVTVFNGGKRRKQKTRKSRKSRKAARKARKTRRR